MREFSESYENKAVTITRKEFGGITARSIVDICGECDEVDSSMTALIKELLMRYSAVIMAEMFKDDTLEVV